MVKCPYCKKEIGKRLIGTKATYNEITIDQNGVIKTKRGNHSESEAYTFNCPNCNEVLCYGDNSVGSAMKFLETGKM